MQSSIKGALPKDGDLAIKVTGSFSWGYVHKNNQLEGNDFVSLKNIDLTVKKGEFVCVIGDVASGKSSLLSAIIGDMIYLSQ